MIVEKKNQEKTILLSHNSNRIKRISILSAERLKYQEDVHHSRVALANILHLIPKHKEIVSSMVLANLQRFWDRLFFPNVFPHLINDAKKNK